jgi:hypothetical protein
VGRYYVRYLLLLCTFIASFQVLLLNHYICFNRLPSLLGLDSLCCRARRHRRPSAFNLWHDCLYGRVPAFLSRFHRPERIQSLVTPWVRRFRWSSPFSTRYDCLYGCVHLARLNEVLFYSIPRVPTFPSRFHRLERPESFATPWIDIPDGLPPYPHGMTVCTVVYVQIGLMKHFSGDYLDPSSTIGLHHPTD